MLKRNRNVLDRDRMREIMNYLANNKLSVLRREFDMSVVRHRV